MRGKLVVGRVVGLAGGEQAVEPLSNQITSHGVQVLDHQRKLAALIAAAYLYKEEHSFESIERLKRAAEVL